MTALTRALHSTPKHADAGAVHIRVANTLQAHARDTITARPSSCPDMTVSHNIRFIQHTIAHQNPNYNMQA